MVKKSASTGNLESLVGAIFGGASHSNTHVVIETSRSDELRLKESSKDKKHQNKKRGSSRPRLNSNSNGNSNPETTGRTKQRRSRSKSHTRTLSSNGSTASGSASASASGVAYPFDVSGIDVEEMDAKLQQLPLKSEQELMADIFRTAEELEDLAKAARRARRRKSGRHPLKRSKSNLSEASISDGSGRSIASSKNSSIGIASVLLSPFVSSTSHHEKPVRRRSFNVSLMGRHSSTKNKNNNNHNSNNNNNNNSTTTRQQKEREKEMPHVSKRLDLRPFELPNHMQYKPSFYHDSDDDDDDLVLDPNEDLNEFSRQVQQDVQNMMITVVTVTNFDNN